MIETALAYLKKGYSVIPVDENKQPLCDWKDYQETPMSEEQARRLFKKAWGIGLICSNNIEVIDFDLKYDLTGEIWYKFMAEVPLELKKRLLVNKTMNGGFHVIYKCDKTEPNHQLARRETTVHEKHETYLKNFLNPKTQEKALRVALQDKIRVLIETRGGVDGIGGGYILIPPSEGYERVAGKGLYKISVEDRDYLHNLARSFDDYVILKSEFTPNKPAVKGEEKDDPFQDFNNRMNILDMIVQYGWSIVSENASTARVKRPGDTKSSSSGLVNKVSNRLTVFSTSHVLYNDGKGCSPSVIFKEIECEGNGKEAYKRLINLGYGKK